VIPGRRGSALKQTGQGGEGGRLTISPFGGTARKEVDASYSSLGLTESAELLGGKKRATSVNLNLVQSDRVNPKTRKLSGLEQKSTDAANVGSEHRTDKSGQREYVAGASGKVGGGIPSHL